MNVCLLSSSSTNRFMIGSPTLTSPTVSFASCHSTSARIFGSLDFNRMCFEAFASSRQNVQLSKVIHRRGLKLRETLFAAAYRVLYVFKFEFFGEQIASGLL